MALHHAARNSRRLLTVILSGIAAMGALWMQGCTQARGTEPTKANATVAVSEIEVATATTQTAPIHLEATGTVRAEFEAAIATRVMGRVQQVLVREGSRVRRGQPLILLDARDLDAAIAQAHANLRAAQVGRDSAQVASRMEDSLSAARIADAEARLTQAQAGLKAAQAKWDLVRSGPRPQERTQAAIAVAQAKSNLILAEADLRRMEKLYQEGAIAAQMYDRHKTSVEVAKAQYDSALESQSIADEGSRSEEIRAAQEAVLQAQAAVAQARAGVRQARAVALQKQVRQQEIQSAQAQIAQSQAALEMARVLRDYAVLVAPFDGVVTQRLVDPGAMASPGVPLMKVQGGALRLEAVVPESALISVRQGMTVSVVLDALKSRSLEGLVTEIAPQGDPSSHTFVVKLTLPPVRGIQAGMFGRARIPTGAEKRLLVPAAAVREREGLHYLFVLDAENRARLRMVTVGESQNGQKSVLSGLSSGERVVISGSEKLTDGTSVGK
jgi:RND family efflux transporter MFP subunit